MATPPRGHFMQPIRDRFSDLSSNLSAYVYHAASQAPSGLPLTDLALAYATETALSDAQLEQPFPVDAGILSFWCGPGSYDVFIVDNNSPPKYKPNTIIRFESRPGDHGITTPMFAPGAVTPVKMASLGSNNLLDGAITANLITDNMMNMSKMAPENVVFGKQDNPQSAPAGTATTLLSASFPVTIGVAYRLAVFAEVVLESGGSGSNGNYNLSASLNLTRGNGSIQTSPISSPDIIADSQNIPTQRFIVWDTGPFVAAIASPYSLNVRTAVPAGLGGASNVSAYIVGFIFSA